jgi:GNAT superfamily N-acetyltransferase
MLTFLSDPEQKKINIRWDLRPGDMGSVIRLHGVLYAREYGYDHTFEGYVAAGLAEVAESFDSRRDRLWVAEQAGEIVGSIAVVKRSAGEAQLRWFLIAPRFRNLGLGRSLLQLALQFGKDCGYEIIYLWTLRGLESATHLYVSCGFFRTEGRTHPLWGKMITEERYELNVIPGGGTALA